MASFSQIRHRIADHFKERGVDRLVYFHCDHFEPWSSVDKRPIADPANVADVVAFAEQCSRIDFARKLTLFYKPHQNNAWDLRQNLIRAQPDDPFGFIPNKPHEEQAFRQAMKHLVDTVDHDIQVHIHHEGYTSNSRHTTPEWVAYSNSAQATERDAQRLALAVRLAKEAIRKETDIELKEWFFVHGLWALQGSDETVCRIGDELGILMREGCRGDFTFPAGRAHVNPRIEVPYFCEAIQRIRGYDEPESNPEAAFGNHAAAKSKFFIWASRIKQEWNSLDYHDSYVRQRLENLEAWAAQLIRDSYYVQGTLFFKTHAHSMQPEYREAARLPIPPHAHPGIQNLLSLVFDGASLADVEVKFATAPEVYDLLVYRGAVWNKQGSDPGSAVETMPAAHTIRTHPAAVVTQGVVTEAEMASAIERVPANESGPSLDEPVWQTSLRELLQKKHADQERMIVDETMIADDRPATTSASNPRSFLREGMPKVVPIALADCAERLNQIACRTMVARIKEMGVNQSGAYNHYARETESGFLVRKTDIAITDLLDAIPSFEEYHEVRAGLGVLTMLIASSGRAAVAIEADMLRHAASTAIFETVSADFPEMQAQCTLLHGRFPQIVEQRELGKSLAIFTDFIATITEAEILASISRYSAALIDIDRFGVQLSSDDERRELLSRFRAAGLKTIQPLLNLGNQGRFYLVSRRRKSVSQPVKVRMKA